VVLFCWLEELSEGDGEEISGAEFIFRYMEKPTMFTKCEYLCFGVGQCSSSADDQWCYLMFATQ
jgi:hypothetical protein